MNRNVYVVEGEVKNRMTIGTVYEYRYPYSYTRNGEKELIKHSCTDEEIERFKQETADWHILTCYEESYEDYSRPEADYKIIRYNDRNVCLKELAIKDGHPCGIVVSTSMNNSGAVSSQSYSAKELMLMGCEITIENYHASNDELCRNRHRSISLEREELFQEKTVGKEVVKDEVDFLSD
ncbi:MAG: hypothetical protein LUH07_06460 [Lachnospiraceae bacterium]|nr:hypothetical protein [Lachnospiraceae bacterium]